MAIRITKQVNYKILDYIGSNGTQFIDSGYQPKTNTTFEIKFSTTSPISSSGATIFGVRHNYTGTGANAYQLTTFTNNSKKGHFLYGGNATTEDMRFDAGIVSGTIHTIKFENGTLTNNGTIVSYPTTSYEVNQKFNMFIFAINFETSVGEKSTTNLYYFKLYEDGELVRDFIPILDNSNVACLYDRVGRNKYYNVGTGTFVAGNETGETIVNDLLPIKKIYIGKSSLAKRIKLAYIGIGGYAKKIFRNIARITYQSQVEDEDRYCAGMCNTENKMFFLGNKSLGNTYAIFEKGTLTKITGTMTTGKRANGTTSVNNYAITTGGGINSSWTTTNVIEEYDESGTRTTSTLPYNAVGGIGSTTGNYALFNLGNVSSGSYVYAYTSTLTRTSCTSLQSSRFNDVTIDSHGPTFDNCAVFAAGSSSGTKQTYAQTYNADLTRRVLPTLSEAKQYACQFADDTHLFIAGGLISGGQTNIVDIYDKYGTHTTMTLANVQYGGFGGEIDDLIFIGYGNNNLIYYYDKKNLTLLETQTESTSLLAYSSATYDDITYVYNNGILTYKGE